MPRSEPKTRAAVEIGRLLAAVDTLDDAAFQVANVAQSHVQDEEPIARLVVVEAIAITNRVRRLNGGSPVTVTEDGFAYGVLPDPVRTEGGRALQRLEGLAMGWERR